MRVVLAVIAATSAGCSSLLGIDDLGLADDAGLTPDAPSDTSGLVCIGTGLLQVCPDPAPTTDLIVLGPEAINTDTDPRCVSLASGSTSVCAIAAASIDIGSELRAIGKRPLVLASMTSISIRGTINVASYHGKIPGAGADRTTCVPYGIPSANGGGAGGSFGGLGGAGGGNGGTQPTPVAPLDEIRGGCPGGRGSQALAIPGSSGGAVYLAAREQITIEGRINASGAGGTGGGTTTGAGGGGGGSGGFIGLDAPAIAGPGMIFANGGGGGAAGSPITAGKDGQESPEAKVEGSGGAGTADGGRGSVSDQLAGVRGESVGINNTGGGGGGGAGQIYVHGTLSVSGPISPPAARDP